MAFFEVQKRSTKSKARTGVLHTPHGDILTPAFVPVATKGTLKTIPPKDFENIGVQVAFVNTFHLVLHPGTDVIKNFGGIHEWSKLEIPLMSDSAGFQMFSLGKHVRINEEGVRFRLPNDGKEIFFTPEFSIEAQEKIGADIIMAFDECIYNNATYEYTKEATNRTHRWLLRCMQTKKREHQFLYGIVQGGMFKDLRKESAKFVASQNIAGIAIGGVSVGEKKREMRNEVSWAMPYLPESLPRHLLGIGRVEDILDFVPLGVDTFDCAEPTRLARNGVVFRKRGKLCAQLDLTKSRYQKDKNPIEKKCACYTCQNFSLSFLHHLFKERELLGYYLATYHNVFFFEKLFSDIRKTIQQGKV